LDLAVNGQNAGIIPVVVGNIAPGWTKDITYTVKNAGSISGVLSLKSGAVTNTEGLNPESETGTTEEPGELGGYITVTATVDDGASHDLGILNNLSSATNIVITDLNAGVEKTVVLHLALPTSVENDVQGDKVVADFILSLDQAAYSNESTTEVILENKDNNWQIISSDSFKGTLSYGVTGPKFNYTFSGKATLPNTGYTLVYVGSTGEGNGWNNGAVTLGSGMTNGSGDISLSGEVTTGTITNGKVWLVPSSTNPSGWDQTNTLFEGTSRVNYTQN